MSENKLKMTFDPHTIEHLGARMYTTLPPVLAELIANAFDADAENVKLTLKDKNCEKEIIIEDDGTGMSFDEINKNFLKIGRNRRKDEKSEKTPVKKRKIMGKKGLGKLSFFGIAHEVEISTRKHGKETVFVMSWENIKNTKNQDYAPEIKKTEKPSKEKGTKIILRKIQRKTRFDSQRLAVSLSRLFIPDSDFTITIKYNDKPSLTVSNDMRYEGLEIECKWKLPDPFFEDVKNGYIQKNGITGHLIATKKPVPTESNMRGITLFSRKKLVNNPEYFSKSTSSHFFSYLTGYLEVDFIDDFEDDMISTNRQSLNWNHPDMKDLRECLTEVVSLLKKDWRKQRTEKRIKKIKEKSGVNTVSWFKKLPEQPNIRKSVQLVVTNIVEHSEMSEKQQQETVKEVHNLVPEYPIYHWRHLHDEIKDASKEKYKIQDYYGAFQEAVKRYVSEVRKKNPITDPSDSSVMLKTFGKDEQKKLTVTQKFKKKDGSLFDHNTINNIEEGQQFLSAGIVQGGRNPVSHEEIVELRESGLFSEKDCLDALSLLSHLFRRLDNAQKR